MTTGPGPLARIRARLHHDERGFTMIEVLAAILIFSVMFAGIASMQGSTLNLIRNNRHRSVAANLAAAEMDLVRSTSFADLPVGQIVTTKTVDTIDYKVTRESQWVATGATVDACQAPPGWTPEYLRVDVMVTWPVMSSIPPVTSQTILSPPVGTYDASSGHLAVRVIDRDAAPVGGVQVSTAGPQALSQFTTSDGCVFFGFLPAGDYTVTVSSSGYVDGQWVAAPTQASSVVVGATSSLLFEYDRAATLDLTLVGKDAGAAAPTTVPITIANSHLLPTGSKIIAGSGSPQQITGVFPYADGYQVWAGSCLDAASGPDPLGVSPGIATSETILMPEVKVQVTAAGLPVPGLPVGATHAPDAGCAAGETYSVGVTDVNGELTFALPFGTWDITVSALPVQTVTLATTDPPGPYVVTVIG